MDQKTYRKKKDSMLSFILFFKTKIYKRVKNIHIPWKIDNIWVIYWPFISHQIYNFVRNKVVRNYDKYLSTVNLTFM